MLYPRRGFTRIRKIGIWGLIIDIKVIVGAKLVAAFTKTHV